MRRRVAGALALLLALCAAPASALPGQTLAEFGAWSSQHKVLAGLRRTTDELSGWPAFTLESAQGGIAWRFTAKSDGKTIRREFLAVSALGGTPGSTPIAHTGTGYGFTFFHSLYGTQTTNDFRRARLVATIKDPTNGVVTHYYRGARFGYALTNGVVIETAAAFAADLALAKRCARSPQSCSE